MSGSHCTSHHLHIDTCLLEQLFVCVYAPTPPPSLRPWHNLKLGSGRGRSRSPAVAGSGGTRAELSGLAALGRSQSPQRKGLRRTQARSLSSLRGRFRLVPTHEPPGPELMRVSG